MWPNPFSPGPNKTIIATKSICKLTHSIWSTIQSNVYFDIHLKPQHQKKPPPNRKLLLMIITVFFFFCLFSTLMVLSIIKAHIMLKNRAFYLTTEKKTPKMPANN